MSIRRPRVRLTVDYNDDGTYQEYDEDLILLLRKSLNLDIISENVFDNVMKIFLEGDLDKIKTLGNE